MSDLGISHVDAEPGCSEQATNPAPATRKRRPRQLSPYECWKQMAASGDVEGLWKIIRDTPWSNLDFNLMFKFLQKACEVACQNDPVQFVENLYGRMISFSAYLVLRSQNVAENLIDTHDRVTSSYGHRPWPEELTQKVLPQVTELQGHLADLVEHYERTSRMWELARRSRRKNERAEQQHDPTPEEVTEPTNGDEMEQRRV